jgi:anti-sigma regulatory factor (Ser/Thr protein kinase)
MRILQFASDSHPYSLRKARRRVHSALLQAGLSIEVARDMEVAVGEALANVHQHAYDGGAGPVSVTVFRSDGGLTAEVNDNGRATAAPLVPSVPPPSTDIRGRGLYMMGRLVDDVAICLNPAGHGLTVRMTTRLKDAA